MALQCGIVGLPNVGKSTLFNAMTAAGAQASNYPFCTIDPNTGVVPLRDPRLDKLAAMYSSEKVVPAAIEFVDIAGLVKGASQGEGLGNQFLANIRNTDAIIHVVRCFEDPDVVHVHGTIDPVNDAEVIITELALADLDTVEKRLAKLEKQAKGQEKEAKAKFPVYERVKGVISQGKRAKLAELAPEEEELIRDGCLLTMKPMLYVANVAEDQLDGKSDAVQKLAAFVKKEKSEMVIISSKIEAEIAQLSEEEKKEFLASLGLEESGLDRLAHAAFRLLALATYFTAGPTEARAWTIHVGDKAPQAAGVIHSDFEKGFIKAEIIGYDDLIACGSEAKAREAGKLRIEGKEYVMKDGDVAHFRFNV